MSNFFDTNIGEVQTKGALSNRGIICDADALSGMGIYPIEYPYPEYDKDTQAIRPVGDPHPKGNDSHVYVQDFEVYELTKEEQKVICDNLKEQAALNVDADTSNTICAGFDCEMATDKGQEKLHFSYDPFDQQNFVDTAVVAMAQKTAAPKSEETPQSVYWNGYREGGELVVLTLDADTFLPLYQTALNHKAEVMAQGSQRKTVIGSMNDAAALRAKMKEWGLSL